MKKLTMILLFTSLSLFAQEEGKPILIMIGNTEFEMEHLTIISLIFGVLDVIILTIILIKGGSWKKRKDLL